MTALAQWGPAELAASLAVADVLPKPRTVLITKFRDVPIPRNTVLEVRCADCLGHYGEPLDQRVACPHCGSTKRGAR